MEFIAFIPLVLVILIFFVLLAKKNKKQGDIFILKISANLSFSDRIALGKYDWTNSNINDKNFSDKAEKDYEVECKLFHFNKSILSEFAIAEMEKEGFKPANILELLKLGEINPNLQREFPIVALDSVWRGADSHHHVPVLNYDDDRRWLSLYWSGLGWGDDCRFLGVRK
jgi:hypothetical protein